MNEDLEAKKEIDFEKEEEKLNEKVEETKKEWKDEVDEKQGKKKKKKKKEIVLIGMDGLRGGLEGIAEDKVLPRPIDLSDSLKE